jgi:hypothetical protein
VVAYRCLPIAFAAEVVVATCGDFFFGDDEGGGESELAGIFSLAEGGEVALEFFLNLGEVVFLDGAALGTEVVAVGLDLAVELVEVLGDAAGRRSIGAAGVGVRCRAGGRDDGRRGGRAG